MTRAQPLCHCVTFPHTVGNHPPFHDEPIKVAVFKFYGYQRADDIRPYNNLTGVIRFYLTAHTVRPYALFCGSFCVRHGTSRTPSPTKLVTNNRQIVGAGALNTCPSPLSLRDISPHCGESPDSPLIYNSNIGFPKGSHPFGQVKG